MLRLQKRRPYIAKHRTDSEIFNANKTRTQPLLEGKALETNTDHTTIEGPGATTGLALEPAYN